MAKGRQSRTKLAAIGKICGPRTVRCWQCNWRCDVWPGIQYWDSGWQSLPVSARGCRFLHARAEQAVIIVGVRSSLYYRVLAQANSSVSPSHVVILLEGPRIGLQRLNQLAYNNRLSNPRALPRFTRQTVHDHS